MKAGLRTGVGRGTIDYKGLRGFHAEAARRAVLKYLKTNTNISEAARMFGITRAVVYDILKKEKTGDLTDRSRAPGRQPRRTPVEVEDKVVAAKNKTRLGPERLSRYLHEYEGVSVSVGTIRHIMRRKKARLGYGPHALQTIIAATLTQEFDQLLRWADARSETDKSLFPHFVCYLICLRQISFQIIM